MDLRGKNVIYIGGFGGIGQKCLQEFLNKRIKNLVIFDLNENTAILKELRVAFPSTHIFYIKFDITSKENIEAAYKEAASSLKHFDVVVNGAGLMNDSFIDLTLQINLLGLINSTLTAMSYMSKASGGAGGLIVNISSVAGLEPNACFPVYVASKFGAAAFTRSLADPLHFQHTGIGFITICPGATDTALLEKLEDKVLFNFTAPMMDNLLQMCKGQTADECAKNLIKTVEFAKNGSVWILDAGNLKELQFPTLWEPILK